MWFVLAYPKNKKTYVVEQITHVGTISEASGLLILTKHNIYRNNATVKHIATKK